MHLNNNDYKLSIAISRRARDSNNDAIVPRSLLVHRLRAGLKAVWRLPRDANPDPPRGGVYCESCRAFTINATLVDDEITCPRCDTVYTLEFAIYTRTQTQHD